MLSVALLLLAIVAAGALAYLRARFVALNAQQRASHSGEAAHHLNEYLSEVFSWMVRGAVAWYADL